MSITFRVFADLHYIDEIPNWPKTRKLVEYSEKILDKFIEDTNIINLGDLIQSTGNTEKDIKNTKYILNKLNRIIIDKHHILGNHELKSYNSNKELLKIFDYSHSSYSFDYENYHFLVIGTDINNDDEKFKTQYVSKEDKLWIRNDLEKNKEKSIIVFCHFGIVDDKDIMQNYWAYTENGENLMLRDRKEILELLSNYNVIGMFCGHQHWTKKLPYKGKYCYMLGSLIEDINEDGIPDGVYFSVVLNEENMKVEEKHIRI